MSRAITGLGGGRPGTPHPKLPPGAARRGRETREMLRLSHSKLYFSSITGDSRKLLCDSKALGHAASPEGPGRLSLARLHAFVRLIPIGHPRGCSHCGPSSERHRAEYNLTPAREGGHGLPESQLDRQNSYAPTSRGAGVEGQRGAQRPARSRQERVPEGELKSSRWRGRNWREGGPRGSLGRALKVRGKEQS